MVSPAARAQPRRRGLYTAVVLAVAAERIAELRVARRNEQTVRARGAVEAGAGHYPVMVALHTGLLVGCLAEVHLADRRWKAPWGRTMLGIVVGAQALRWWCIRTLGPRWNTKILVLPDEPLVDTGPYRWLDHPNYVAVVAEGFALPMAHTAWVTAGAFGAANAALLRVRIRAEDHALRR